jgi:hypothetical protein
MPLLYVIPVKILKKATRKYIKNVTKNDAKTSLFSFFYDAMNMRSEKSPICKIIDQEKSMFGTCVTATILQIVDVEMSRFAFGKR